MDNKRIHRLLQECISACNHCAEACKKEENPEKLQQCIALDTRCAEICHTTSEILEMDFNAKGDVLQACQAICIACAEECEKHDHEHCRKCAEACRQCSIECEDVQAEVA